MKMTSPNVPVWWKLHLPVDKNDIFLCDENDIPVSLHDENDVTTNLNEMKIMYPNFLYWIYAYTLVNSFSAMLGPIMSKAITPEFPCKAGLVLLRKYTPRNLLL